eukprot:TRINITY_DN6035_c0_g1_i4.p1 TRINITY_DN6035_c0_g1~~TRINITY_DN6035_c0_g1_i4.p1  ORF type:complete len:237 (+),score=29.43 TRINITY_DN6035_c0_g1_i4:99-809(+)
MVSVIKQNFRDVGESILLAWNSDQDEKHGAARVVLPRGRLFRCGRLEFCSWEDLGCPQTIICLRAEPDEPVFSQSHNVNYLHAGADNSLENYETTNKGVRAWIASVVKLFENEDLSAENKESPSQGGLRFPVLVHCRAGRDRTGLIIAALLKILDVPDEVIIREYAMSDSPKTAMFMEALNGFRAASGKSKPKKGNKKGGNNLVADPESGLETMRAYFRHEVDVDKVRANLMRGIE